MHAIMHALTDNTKKNRLFPALLNGVGGMKTRHCQEMRQTLNVPMQKKTERQTYLAEMFNLYSTQLP